MRGKEGERLIKGSGTIAPCTHTCSLLCQPKERGVTKSWKYVTKSCKIKNASFFTKYRAATQDGIYFKQ